MSETFTPAVERAAELLIHEAETTGLIREDVRNGLAAALDVTEMALALMPTLNDSWWCGDHVDYHETDGEGEPLVCCIEARADQARIQATAIRTALLGADS